MKPYTCPPQLSDVATLHWEIQKRHLSTLLFIYFRLFTLAQKKTSSNCCSAALSVYLLLFSASYYRHSPMYCVWGTLQEERVYWYGHVAAFGSSLLWRGLNFSTAWYTTRLIGVKEAWKHILMQKVVTLNTSYPMTLLAWHSNCDGFISESLTTTHNWLSNVWKNATNLQLDEKVSKFTS